MPGNNKIVKYSNLSEEQKEKVFQLKLDFNQEIGIEGSKIDGNHIRRELDASLHFVSLEGEEPVGFVELTRINGEVELTEIYASKKRSGIGTKLFVRSIAYARATRAPLKISHQTSAGKKHFLAIAKRYANSRKARGVSLHKQSIVFVGPERTLQTPSVHFRKTPRKHNLK